LRLAEPKAVGMPRRRMATRVSRAPGSTSSAVSPPSISTYQAFFWAAIASRSSSDGFSPPTSSKISNERMRLTPLSRSLCSGVKSKPSPSASLFHAR